MDDPTVNWEQARYEECVSKLKPYLKQVRSGCRCFVRSCV
jgi:translation elongation factor EF-1alpha